MRQRDRGDGRTLRIRVLGVAGVSAVAVALAGCGPTVGPGASAVLTSTAANTVVTQSASPVPSVTSAPTPTALVPTSTASDKPSPSVSRSDGAIPWIAVAPDLSEDSAPDCTQEQITWSGTWETNVGSGPRRSDVDMIGIVTLTNLSPVACALPGNPRLALLGADGHPLALEQRPARGWPGSTDRLLGNASDRVLFEWRPSWCGVDPGGSPKVQLTAGQLATTVQLKRDALDLAAHTPSCVHGASPSVLEVAEFQPSPQDVESPQVNATVSGLPTAVTRGQKFSYVVTLTTDRPVEMHRCPAYTEQLGQRKETYALNCAGAVLKPGHPLAFAMTMTAPRDEAFGDTVLYWECRDLAAVTKTGVTFLR